MALGDEPVYSSEHHRNDGTDEAPIFVDGTYYNDCSDDANNYDTRTLLFFL